MSILQNKILKTELVNWQELKDLQPKNLKISTHNEKTKKSLVKNGFSFAFYVWQNGNDIFLLDGHLRTDLLRELVSEGYEVPEKLTCTFLDLKNKKEAVKYLLEVFNTKKNPIDENVLIDWIKVEEIKIPEIDIDFLDTAKTLQTETKITDDKIEQDEHQLYLYNEFMLFPKTNKYHIPDLNQEMIYDGQIDDILWSHNEEKDENKTYLALYGQMAVDERLEDQVIGFFVDDSRFDVVWNNAIQVLYKFDKIKPKALLTPNFSIWADEPKPFQIISWYKTMWCGRYWQEAGYKIIPTLNWADESSFEFCFLGLPKKMKTAIIQTRNVKTKSEFINFEKGLNHIKNNFEISKLFVYGSKNQDVELMLEGFNWARIRSWMEKKQNT